MKKVLIGLAALIVLILVAVYVVLFTSPGNKLVASIIEDKAKAAGLDLNVTTFKLRFSSLDVAVNVANMLTAKVEGNLSLFKLGFDLDYLLSVNKDYAKSMNLNLANDLNFGGSVNGKASDFTANGSGYLFGSNIALNARVLDYSPIELKLSANGIKIEELLDLISTPRYALGVLNVNADISAKDLKPEGSASVNLYTNSINYKLLKQDMNLTLPKNSEITANIIANVAQNAVNATSEVKNSYLTFNTTDTKYDIEKGVATSDFALKIPNLSKLNDLAGIALKGNLNMDGNVSAKGTALDELNAVVKGSGVGALGLSNINLNLNANAKGDGADKIDFTALLNSNLVQIPSLKGYYKTTNSELDVATNLSVPDLSKFSGLAGTTLKGSAAAELSAHLLGSAIKSLKANADIAGGKITATSDGATLDAAIDNVGIANLLALAAQPAYASGSLNAKAHLSSLDFSNLNGNFSANSSGTLGQKALSKMLEKSFPANSKYSFNLTGDIKNSVASFSSNVKSDFANLNNVNGTFDIKNTKLNSSFVVDVPDFSKFNWLAERKLTGKASFNGTANFNKSLNATLTSDNIFKGKLDAKLNGNTLDATLTQVDFSTLMKGVDLPDYYDVKATVKANYNTATSNGTVNANLNNGKLKSVGIIKTLETLTKSDFSKDSFTDGNLDATLSKNAVSMNLALKSARVTIGIDKGVVNTTNSKLNMPFTLGVDKASFKGTVGGTTSSPSVSLDMGSVVDSAVKKALSNEKIKEKGAEQLNKLLDKLF